MAAANRQFGQCPRRGPTLHKASFASCTAIRIDSTTLEKILNGIQRHKISIRNAGGMGRWAEFGVVAFSGPCSFRNSRVLLEWDLRRHRQRKCTTSNHLPSGISSYFLRGKQGSTFQQHPEDDPLYCQEKMPTKNLKGEGMEGQNEQIW